VKGSDVTATFGSILRREHVFVDVPPCDRDDAFREILSRIVQTGALTDEGATTVLRAMLQRERLGATAVGRGIALPHCKTAAVTAPFVAFARMRTPIEFAAVDGDPVHSILLVVSPPAAADVHLEILKSVARIARDDYSSRVLRNTRDADALYDFLREMGGQ